jgi:two-component system alkaline phosphatase synthesis response regulator PhoP
MDNSRHKILLVDDEPDILEFLNYNLKKEGYTVFTACNGKEAIARAIKENPHLIILDVMMPDIDGIETCREIRETPEIKDVLIVFLSARNEDYSQIAGFDVGADSYINKPIKPRVLISRINALLRRKGSLKSESAETTEFGEIKIDHERYVVIKKGVDINLPKKEFELISLLTSKPGKVFTRDIILDKIWGGDVIIGARSIDVHISKLREKLGEDLIKTISGIGYKFES